MPLWVSLILVVLFLLMNAFFVIAEFALVRVRKSQLELALENGKRGAKSAIVIAENVNKYLSACQLGITLASLALGWLGEPFFASLIRMPLETFGVPESLISVIAVAIGYFIMTTLHVVVGELIPKSFAIFATERYALFTAGPLMVFYKVTYPVMLLFNGITNAVVRLSGHDPANEHEVYTDDEIKLLIDESTESGLVSPVQNECIDNIFDLDDKDAEAIMTPRTDLICLDVQNSFKQNLELAKKFKFSHYPVCRGSKDKIIGYAKERDLYALGSNSKMTDLQIREIPAVPESIPVAKLMQAMCNKQSKIVVVVDEHGGTAGIVTMSDVVSQIIGHIDGEYHKSETDVEKLSETTMLLDGGMPIHNFTEIIGFEPEDASECETLGGLIMGVLDRIPKEGDVVKLCGKKHVVSLKVINMNHHRTGKVKLKLLPNNSEVDAS